MTPDPEQKISLRALAIARRAACDPALGAELARHVLESGIVPAGAIVAGFWPMRGEIDILHLLEALSALGHQICLPVTPRPGTALHFHLWTPGTELVVGRYGTMHPPDEILVRPDFLLVPLLAFDASGHRLGYGGGYYDRTLAALPRAFRLGCAFAAQQIDSLPVGPHDRRLHAIATERGILRRA